MKFGVVRFPGSNCDQDAFHVVKDVLLQPVEYIWHQASSVKGFDCIILPGGFSYGDYLRTGAIARFSPVMDAVREHASRGRLVLGICNGFQILCEAGLLPGALVRNKGLKFVCRDIRLRVENRETPFTLCARSGINLRIPVAHGEGRYIADAETLELLEQQNRIVFRYCDAAGQPTLASNPNGSMSNIAGIVGADFNVLGLMPHPERAAERILGSRDGKTLFESIVRFLRAN